METKVGKVGAASVLALLVVWLLTGCDENKPPAPESGSGQQYDQSAQIPVDDGVYTIRGTVVAEVESIVRQTSPGGGYLSGSKYYLSGTFWGPEMGGKGLVRLAVTESNVDLAPAGTLVLLKVEDTKAQALLPGDNPTFLCRKQYENLSAVRKNETFDADRLGTWELDYCRLRSPGVGKVGE